MSGAQPCSSGRIRGGGAGGGGAAASTLGGAAAAAGARRRPGGRAVVLAFSLLFHSSGCTGALQQRLSGAGGTTVPPQAARQQQLGPVSCPLSASSSIHKWRRQAAYYRSCSFTTRCEPHKPKRWYLCSCVVTAHVAFCLLAIVCFVVTPPQFVQLVH